MNPTTEYHYAPLTGALACMVDGKPETVDGWPAHHELMRRFLKLKADGAIVHLHMVSFGHAHFHGHRGRVDIYGHPTPAAT